MSFALKFLAGWFALSVPVGLLVGRFLRLRSRPLLEPVRRELAAPLLQSSRVRPI